MRGAETKTFTYETSAEFKVVPRLVEHLPLIGHFDQARLAKGTGQKILDETPASFPGAAELIDDPERWRRYILDSLIETTISRDILLLTRVDKPALLRRLFQLGCAYSGQILSFMINVHRVFATPQVTGRMWFSLSVSLHQEESLDDKPLRCKVCAKCVHLSWR